MVIKPDSSDDLKKKKKHLSSVIQLTCDSGSVHLKPSLSCLSCTTKKLYIYADESCEKLAPICSVFRYKHRFMN